MSIDSSREPPPSPRELLARSRSKSVLFAFDFDGTLTPIVSRPEDVRLPVAVGRAIADASAKFQVLICTGRAVADLMAFLPAHANLEVIGNHGLEFREKDGRVRSLETPAWKEWRETRLPKLADLIRLHGGMIEDKRYSISLHYRLEGPDYWTSDEGVSQLRALLIPGLTILPGTKVWNVLPEGASKGQALLEHWRKVGYERIIYFGDEPTDETVFVRAGDMPLLGVKVGEGPTAAQYRIRDVAAVQDWVAQLSMLDSGLM